jgi:hypothetical protein
MSVILAPLQSKTGASGPVQGNRILADEAWVIAEANFVKPDSGFC